MGSEAPIWRWRPPERRLTFGQVAELYEEVRPSYPPQLVEDAIAYAQLQPGEPILEVGAGTGKATRLFARDGREIVAIEPSPEMAAVAHTTCAQLPSVTIIETDFEHWALPKERFKLLICAQAWHWIDQDVRYSKARAALESNGAPAVFWNHPDWQGVEARLCLAKAS